MVDRLAGVAVGEVDDAATEAGFIREGTYADGTPGQDGQSITLDFTLDFNMRFRSGPGAGFEEVGRIPRGTRLVAVGRTVDGLWIAVDYAGQYGWLAAQYGRLTGDVMRLPVASVG